MMAAPGLLPVYPKPDPLASAWAKLTTAEKLAILGALA